MLALELEEFAIELKDGSVKNVGAPNKAATAKLYDVEEAEARPFGDGRVKFAFADGEGNEVEIALPVEDARTVVAEAEDAIESLESDD